MCCRQTAMHRCARSRRCRQLRRRSVYHRTARRRRPGPEACRARGLCRSSKSNIQMNCSKQKKRRLARRALVRKLCRKGNRESRSPGLLLWKRHNILRTMSLLRRRMCLCKMQHPTHIYSPIRWVTRRRDDLASSPTQRIRHGGRRSPKTGVRWWSRRFPHLRRQLFRSRLRLCRRRRCRPLRSTLSWTRPRRPPTLRRYKSQGMYPQRRLRLLPYLIVVLRAPLVSRHLSCKS